MAPPSQQLPLKEANSFRQIVRLYEQKQYKKAIKQADSILKKFPEHGETLAMKGLVLGCMHADEKEKAYDFVRKGLRHNMRSHVCWHVFGLLYRQDGQFEEASKSFKNALRIDKENFQIMRDLSMLQVQMRDLEGFVETRRSMLVLNATRKASWVGFAIASALNGDYQQAIKAIESYERVGNSSAEAGNDEAYKLSEQALFKVYLRMKMGDLEAALKDLEENKSVIVDVESFMEYKAKIFLQLNRVDDAEKMYRELLERNSECYSYHEGLLRCLGVSSCDVQNVNGASDDLQEYAVTNICDSDSILPITFRLVAVYQELAEKYPRSLAVQRIPLNWSKGNSFESRVYEYAVSFIARGIPSFFADMKPLYANEEKARILDKVFWNILESVQKDGRLPAQCNATGAHGDVHEQGVMWIKAYLAQHCAIRGEYKKSVELIDEAISHTPTCIDLYLFKAQILENGGDVNGAAALTERARKMDLQDRYLNTVSAKMLMRADKTSTVEADHPGSEEVMRLFTKEGTYNNLYDMQCMWYEIETGKSFVRQKKFGRAIKKFVGVQQHFDDFYNDQFDFHSYCIRQMTLRAYMDLMDFEDNVYGHSYFVSAIQHLVEIYLHLAVSKNSSDGKDTAYEGMTPEEIKKAKRKERRRQARQAAGKEGESQTKTAGSSSSDKPVEYFGSKVDEDPEGEKYLSTETPLDEAAKYVRRLEKHAGNDPQTWLLSARVAIQREKLSLALRAAFKAHEIDSKHPATVETLVCVFEKLAESKDGLSAELSAAVNQLRSQLLGGESVSAYVGDLSSSAAKPLSAALAVALARSASTCKGGVLSLLQTASSLFPEDAELRSSIAKLYADAFPFSTRIQEALHA